MINNLIKLILFLSFLYIIYILIQTHSRNISKYNIYINSIILLIVSCIYLLLYLKISYDNYPKLNYFDLIDIDDKNIIHYILGPIVIILILFCVINIIITSINIDLYIKDNDDEIKNNNLLLISIYIFILIQFSFYYFFKYIKD
jgi:hypothetical protein